MRILLFILSFILVIVLSPIGLLVSIFSYKSIYYFRLAVSLDQFGNVVMSHLFNLILISGLSTSKFGDPDETISSVLGKNKQTGTLRYLGKRLVALLDGLDKNHSIKSIEK